MKNRNAQGTRADEKRMQNSAPEDVGSCLPSSLAGPSHQLPVNMHQICMANLTPFSLASVTSR